MLQSVPDPPSEFPEIVRPLSLRWFSHSINMALNEEILVSAEVGKLSLVFVWSFAYESSVKNRFARNWCPATFQIDALFSYQPDFSVQSIGFLAQEGAEN